MKVIPVTSSRGNYQILVGERLLDRTGQYLKALGLTGKIFVVTQKSVASHYLGRLLRSLVSKGYKVSTLQLPEGERAKSRANLFLIYRHLLKNDCERRDLIVALGGGVIGDIAGYAAASYMRGIAFINIATTLLAQVDSSVGGKTAINLSEGKNLVGAFYPPRLVISDIGVLKTLPEREFRASLAEVVKYGMIRNAKLFSLLEKTSGQILNQSPALLKTIVTASAGIKAEVVGRDEFENKGERMILNFGHTFAHAFEQASSYRVWMHGEAVSIGMVAATRLAVILGLCPEALDARLRGLLTALKLPVSLAPHKLDIEKILYAMLRDKKKDKGELRFVLPRRAGKVEISNVVPAAQIKKVILELGAH